LRARGEGREALRQQKDVRAYTEPQRQIGADLVAALAAAAVAELPLDEPWQSKSFESAEGLQAQIDLGRRFEVEKRPRGM
jgi:hypothetical protein